MAAFHIWNFPIHRYGIFYLLGFIAAYFFLKYIGKTKLFADRPKLQNLLETGVEEIMIYAVIGGILGGRLWQVIIYDLQYYLANPAEIFAIRKWWMAFIGGILGTFISFLILKSRKGLSRTELFLLLDSIIVTVGFWIMLGRIGNFLNQELYGILVPVGARWIGERLTSLLKSIHIFHVYPSVDDALRVNTNFLASFFEGLGTILITGRIFYKWLKTKKYDAGHIAWIFLTYYSAIRFLLEYMRMDSQSEFIWPFTTSQRFFIIFFILGRSIMLFKKIARGVKEAQKKS